ncbi:MAG: CPCC family cysteine-rich protein [Oscillospiraceae bacterium]
MGGIFICNKCQCCGFLTVPKENSVGFICPVCFWEVETFLPADDQPSGCNHSLTLNQSRANFAEFGACCKEMVSYVRAATIEEKA